MVGGGRPLLPEISSSTTLSEKKVQLESVQLRKHCNEGRPTSCQSLSPLITTPMLSMESHSICCRVLTADTLRYTVTLTFDSVTLTFLLWSLTPRTCLVDLFCYGQTLYQIWAKSDTRGWVLDHLENFRLENLGQILHFYPPPIITGVSAKFPSQGFKLSWWPNLWCTFDEGPQRVLEDYYW